MTQFKEASRRILGSRVVQRVAHAPVLQPIERGVLRLGYNTGKMFNSQFTDTNIGEGMVRALTGKYMDSSQRMMGTGRLRAFERFKLGFHFALEKGGVTTQMIEKAMEFGQFFYDKQMWTQAENAFLKVNHSRDEALKSLAARRLTVIYENLGNRSRRYERKKEYYQKADSFDLVPGEIGRARRRDAQVRYCDERSKRGDITEVERAQWRYEIRTLELFAGRAGASVSAGGRLPVLTEAKQPQTAVQETRSP